MNTYSLNNLFELEIYEIFNQIKEKIIYFFKYPKENQLINLIFSDLDNLEFQSFELGLEDLTTSIKQFHDHLNIMNSNNDLLNQNEIQTCINEIHVIEKVIENHCLAS